MWTPWRRQRLNARLSAYLDGELDVPDQDEVTDRIVLDATTRATLDAFAAVDRLVDEALAPPHLPDREAAADRLLSLCHAQASPPRAARLPARRRHLAPAVVASVGILVTAGVTFMGLRRRGLV